MTVTFPEEVIQTSDQEPPVRLLTCDDTVLGSTTFSFEMVFEIETEGLACVVVDPWGVPLLELGDPHPYLCPGDRLVLTYHPTI